MDYQDSLDEPLRTQLTRQTKQLITLEKQMIYDDNYNRDNVCSSIEKPSTTIVGGGTKRLITCRAQFIAKYFNGKRSNGNIQHHCEPIEVPFPTVTTVNRNVLMTAQAQFISPVYNSNGKPEANNHSIDKPLNSITTHEKFQFITAYFNSSGNPESQNQSIDKPLNTILTAPNKKALVTADADKIDFDIRMRFLNEDELAAIMGVPPGYFKKGKKLSKKAIIRMIGNAVHVRMAELLINEISGCIAQKQAV
jgi:site-specific DNA-cytosine methylase